MILSIKLIPKKFSNLAYEKIYIWILFWFQKFVLMNDLIESCDVLFLNIVEVWTIIYIWLKARRALSRAVTS